MSTAIEGAFIILMAFLALLGAGICIGSYFRRRQRRELLPKPSDDNRDWQSEFERYLDQR